MTPLYSGPVAEPLGPILLYGDAVCNPPGMADDSGARR